MSTPAQGGLFACCFGGQPPPSSPRSSTKDDTIQLARSLSLTQANDINSTGQSGGDSVHHTDGVRQQLQAPQEADAQRMQEDVLRVVSLLQELLSFSTNALRQPMSKAMALLCTRLPVAYACLYAISPSGLVFQQVGGWWAGAAHCASRECASDAGCVCVSSAYNGGSGRLTYS